MLPAGELISETQLRASDALMVMFEAFPGGAKLLTPDGRLARINATALREMEMDRAGQVLGQEWAELWPAAQQHDARDALARALSGESSHFQGYRPTARGAPKWWEVSVSPIRDANGAVAALFVASHEIRDSAAARQALVTVAEDGVISGWSAEAEGMFGWSAQEAIGRGVDLILPERQREPARAWSERILQPGTDDHASHRRRSVGLRRSGEEFPTECVASVVQGVGSRMLLIAVEDVGARAQTELFEHAFQNAPIGEALVNLEGRFLKLNPAFCALLGYDEATLLAEDFQSITHPDDLADDLAGVRRLLAGDIADYRVEKRYMRADGSPVWVSLSVSLVRRPDGRPSFFIAQVEDLTARRRAETLWRALTENLSDVVGLYDEQGRCLYISPAAKPVFGYDPEELVADPTYQLFPEDMRQVHQAYKARLLAAPFGQTVVEQLPMRRKDGTLLWVEAACRLMEDPAGRRLTVAVIRDISERLESERRYRLLADNMADMLLLTDLDGRAHFVAGASERILGWTPDEILAQCSDLLLHPDDHDRVHEAFVRVGQGEPGLRVRFRSRCKDGSWRWLESRPSLYVEPGGRPGVVDAVRDITEQVAQDEALARAREEAEAAALAKSRFLANMSHEIRTPLTSVIGFSDLLLGLEPLAGDARRYAERIGAASRALLTLVNDILDFSKIEAGQFEILPAPTRPLELVEEAISIFASTAEAKGVALRLETAVPAAAMLDIDAARVRQVLLNLIGNAVKFTERGEVVVRLDRAAGRMAVAVADTGPGVAAENQSKLFQRFSQIDASSTRRHGGTGLGLAICKGLVEAMGGSIGLTSRPGEGSTFAFDIAAPPSRAAGTQPRLGGAPAHIEQVRVLVADDNPANRELVRAFLESFGVEAAIVADGRQAVAAALGASYDVILMDLRMPGLDGHGALDAIRAAPGPNQATPILAFTADVLDTELARFDGAVAKPIEPARLAAAIESCLAAGRAKPRRRAARAQASA